MVRLFESDPIEDEGKGTGPYSALVEFEFRFENGVWQLDDIHVSLISDRLEVFDLSKMVAGKISAIKVARREIERTMADKRASKPQGAKPRARTAMRPII